MEIRANPNENYTLLEMANLSWSMMKEEWYDRGPTKHFLSDFLRDLKLHSQMTQYEVAGVVLVTILFTVHRLIFTKLIISPITRYIGFSQKDGIKFSESACKLLYYSLLFAFEYYLVIHKYPEIRYDVSSHWRDWTPTLEIPLDILGLYITEAGFYFHSVYATICLDVWRKDSIAMLVHHVLANSLILFSLCFRYHKVGLVVLYLHDVADIFMESSKIIICLKNKFNSTLLEVLSAIGFLSFTFVWFWCRLFLYPQIVLFSTCYLGRTMLPQASFFFFFNVLLSALMFLNVWWFHFILALVYRIATGQTSTVEDTREYEESDGVIKKKVTFESNGHQSAHGGSGANKTRKEKIS